MRMGNAEKNIEGCANLIIPLEQGHKKGCVWPVCLCTLKSSQNQLPTSISQEIETPQGLLIFLSHVNGCSATFELFNR